MTSFTGIWVPLVTPFCNGEVDYQKLRTLARRLADAGVSGLVVCGSTGEAAALSAEEQLATLDTVLEAVPDKPVLMGLAGNNIKSVLAHLDELHRRPIAGLLTPAPYYIRPSQAALVDYFRTLADASSVPLVLYNIPYRTGVPIALDTFRTLAKHPRIVAVKDCGVDLQLTMDLIADDQLQVLCGEDAQLLAILSLGGSGAVAASAHIRPELFVRIGKLVAGGELSEARRIFYTLLPLIRLVFAEPNPAPLKAGLSALGQLQNELRQPMQTASSETRETMLQELKRLECV